MIEIKEMEIWSWTIKAINKPRDHKLMISDCLQAATWMMKMKKRWNKYRSNPGGVDLLFHKNLKLAVIWEISINLSVNVSKKLKNGDKVHFQITHG